MESGQVWGIVGVVIGVLGLVGAVFQVLAYRRDNPRRRLEYTVTRKRLVEHDARAKLQITVDGIKVENPHLVEFDSSPTAVQIFHPAASMPADR